MTDKEKLRKLRAACINVADDLDLLMPLSQHKAILQGMSMFLKDACSDDIGEPSRFRKYIDSVIEAGKGRGRKSNE